MEERQDSTRRGAPSCNGRAVTSPAAKIAGVGGAALRIDDHAVIDGQARGGGKLDIRHDANAGNDQIRVEAPVRATQHHAFPLAPQGLDADRGADLHALRAMQLRHPCAHRVRHAAREQARLCLQHRHMAAVPDRGGCHLEPDEAAANHDDPASRFHAGLQPQRILEGSQVVHGGVADQGGRQLPRA
ncbi:MAG: hypothetical protein WDN49_14495 [Acetobacteraceae bacterium]